MRTFGFLAGIAMVMVACSSADESSRAGAQAPQNDAGQPPVADAASDAPNDAPSDAPSDSMTDAESDADSATEDASTDAGAEDDADAGIANGNYPYGAYGTYKPGPTTCGVPAGMMLTPYTNQLGAIVNGVLTITTPNVTISGYDIPAYIVVKADAVTIEKCRVHGPPMIPPGNVSHNLITAYDTKSTNLEVRDCTIFASVPDHNSQGLQGKSFTAERNDIHDVVDGIDPLNDGAVILANCIHDLAWFAPDSNHADNHSHNDCVQIEGGSATIQYNNLEGFLSKTAGDGPARPYDQSNSVFQLSDATNPPTTKLLIDHNWMDGGQVAVNVGGTSYTTLGAITNNVMGDNQYYDGVTILLNAPRASMGLTIIGNTYGAIDMPLHKASRNGTAIDTGNGVSGG